MSAARLFVAVWPPDSVLDEIARIPRILGPDTRMVSRRDQWHVTLVFLGSVEIAQATEAFERIAFEGCEAVLGPAVEMLGRSVVVLPVSGLDRLAAAVRRELPGGDERPFAAHLTLAREPKRRRNPMVGIEFTARFAVREIALVQSHNSRDGARYETIAWSPTPPA